VNVADRVRQHVLWGLEYPTVTKTFPSLRLCKWIGHRAIVELSVSASSPVLCKRFASLPSVLHSGSPMKLSLDYLRVGFRHDLGSL